MDAVTVLLGVIAVLNVIALTLAGWHERRIAKLEEQASEASAKISGKLATRCSRIAGMSRSAV